MPRPARTGSDSEAEGWSHVDDPIERRKIQNRNNQRALRKRRLVLKQTDQTNDRPRRSVKPLLLPKPPATACVVTPVKLIQDESSDASEEDTTNSKTLTPTAFSVHDVAGTGLDMDTRRVFHYATTCLWVDFSQHVIETNECLAAAMTRVSMKSDLVMHTFLWTAANELQMHSSHPSNQRVLLRQQNQAVAKIQQRLDANEISDELIFAIYALVSAPSPAGLFKEREVLPCRHYSTWGDFDPPLTSLGSINYMSQMCFDDKHAEAANRLLEPRGGLHSMKALELTYQMQAFDLLRDSKKGSKPTFNLCKSYKHILDFEMPLYRASNSFSDFANWPISKEFRNLFLDLRCYLRQVDLYMAKAQPIVPPETLVAWRNINQHRVLSLPSDKDELFRLSALIFSYSVTFPVPYRDVVKGWARELVSYIHQSPDESEATLWAVVIAAMCDPDDEVVGCLVEKGKRIKSVLKLEKWFDLKTIMTRYLWLESACDIGGQRFWNLISNGVQTPKHHDPDVCSLAHLTWMAFT